MYIGHGLKLIGSGDAEGAGLGAQLQPAAHAAAGFCGVFRLTFSLFPGAHEGPAGLLCA